MPICREAGSGPPLGAYADLLAVLTKYVACGLAPHRVVVHCFTGGEAYLRALSDAGLSIGVTGFVGMKKRAAPTVAALVSGDLGTSLLRAGRLHLETDAPFMLPDAEWVPPGVKHAIKGRNEPCIMPAVCRAVAAALAHGAGDAPTAGEVAQRTAAASSTLFRLDVADAAAIRMNSEWAAEAATSALAEASLAEASAPEASAPAASDHGAAPVDISDGSGVQTTQAAGESSPSGKGGRVRGPNRRRQRGRGDSGAIEFGRVRRNDYVQGAPLSVLPPPPPLPPSLCPQARAPVGCFEDDTWAAADWAEDTPPKSYSAFLLPLLYSGVADAPDAALMVLMDAVSDAHFSGRPRATTETIHATQPLWEATFSHWPTWRALVRDATAAGTLTTSLQAGVSAKAAWILSLPPHALAAAGVDAAAYGAVPHLKPRSQNDAVEAALGPVESARFYASVSSLFAAGKASGA